MDNSDGPRGLRVTRFSDKQKNHPSQTLKKLSAAVSASIVFLFEQPCQGNPAGEGWLVIEE